MKALVLCGGLGTRLRSVVSDLPKCLAPVNDKPFLYYVLKHLNSQLVRDVTLCTSYMHDKIYECFGDSFMDIRLSYSIQKQPEGTGLALRNAARELPRGTNRVIILNGDTFLPILYHEVIARHVKLRARVTVVAWEDIIAGTFVADVAFLKKMKKKRFEDNLPEVAVFDSEFPFLDIGTPKDYSRAQLMLR